MQAVILILIGESDDIYKSNFYVFPGQESLFSDIPAVDGKIVKPFLQCRDSGLAGP